MSAFIFAIVPSQTGSAQDVSVPYSHQDSCVTRNWNGGIMLRFQPVWIQQLAIRL